MISKHEDSAQVSVNGVVRKITSRYLTALLLVFSMSLGAYYMLSQTIKSQKSAGAIVNASGRRRMASQRIVMFANMILTAQNEADWQKARNGLMSAVDMLEKDHNGLLQGDASLGLPGHPSKEISGFYFDAPTNLDARLKKFIQVAKHLSTSPAGSIQISNPDVTYLNENGPTNILDDLNKAVNLYQKEGDDDVANIHRTELAILSLTLLLLGLEATLIFKPMTAQIKNEMLDVHRKADEIKARTETIETIYNNVHSGFLLIDETFKILPGFTKSCQEMFLRPIAAGELITEVLNLEGNDRAMFEMTCEQVFTGFLGDEISISQMPKIFKLNERTIRLDASVIRNPEDAIQSLMLTVNDVTSLKDAEEKNAFYASLVKILQQKDAFRSFMMDCKNTFASCREAHARKLQAQVRFYLHTLKGNATAFGLTRIAKFVHDVEEKAIISLAHIDSVENHIREFLATNIDLLQISYEEQLQRSYVVEVGELEHLKVSVTSLNETRQIQSEIITWINTVKRVPAQAVFHPLMEASSILANRLLKNVNFVLTDKDCKVDVEYLEPVLKTLIHIYRNSVDHAVELPGQRGVKPEYATITTGISETEKHWIIKISDDGKGIDTSKLLLKAHRMGMLANMEADRMTEKEKVELIFKDGFSTSDEVSQVSGRGVGMAAVKFATESLGGKVEVDTAKGRGTTFTLQIPKNTARTSVPHTAQYLKAV